MGRKFSQKNDLRAHMKEKHKEQLLLWYTNAKKISDENKKVNESSKDLKVSDEKKSTGNKRIWPCGKCEQCLLDDCGDCIPCVNKKKNGGTGKLKQKCVEKSCPIQEKLKQELRVSKSNITNKPVHDPNTKKAQGTSKAPKTKPEKQMGKSESLLSKAVSKEFQCPYCNGKFAWKSSLRKHVKLRHEEQFEITDFSLISDNQKSSNENDAKMDKSSRDLTEFEKFIKKRKSTESLGNTKKTPRTSKATKSKSKKQIEQSDDLEKDDVGPEVTLLSTGSGNKIEKPSVALIQVFGEDDL